MSPLLFAITNEPLAIAFRSKLHITGVFRGDIKQRFSLYADYLLLYISNPDVSLPIVFLMHLA
jgi:hypothetical protein